MPGTRTTGSMLMDRINELFGAAFVWVRGFKSTHSGIDLSAKRGTPVYAITDGIIKYAGYEATDASAPTYVHGGGNVVLIKTGTGQLENLYAHLDTLAVRSGQYVKKGELIGTVGMTGGPNKYAPNVQAPTGYHLHFGVWDTATRAYIDPIPFIKSTNIGEWLSFWNGTVSFPTGHRLTTADVDAIIAKLDGAHFFQATQVIPGLQQLAENQARDKVRSILTAHVGEEWNADLAAKLQTELFGAATAAVDNPLNNIASLIGKLFDPGIWIRILALIVGLVIAAFGGVSLLRSSAS